MIRIILAAALAAALSHAVAAGEPVRLAQVATHQALGTVNKVDAAAGKINLKHEPVPSIRWPAMTMDFKLADAAVAAGVKPGDRVEFVFEQRGKDYVVTRIEKRAR